MPSSKKKKENVPVLSMAGLIRYYEEEKGRIRIDPKVVIIASIALSVGVLVLTKFFPLI
ncbi:MAG: preprotein translocase subunit Sec61beta [Sulfolobaceae archaeon]